MAWRDHHQNSTRARSLDIDLAILGQSAEVFAAYDEAIRQECIEAFKANPRMQPKSGYVVLVRDLPRSMSKGGIILPAKAPDGSDGFVQQQEMVKEMPTGVVVAVGDPIPPWAGPGGSVIPEKKFEFELGDRVMTLGASTYTMLEEKKVEFEIVPFEAVCARVDHDWEAE